MAVLDLSLQRLWYRGQWCWIRPLQLCGMEVPLLRAMKVLLVSAPTVSSSGPKMVAEVVPILGPESSPELESFLFFLLATCFCCPSYLKF